MTDSQDNPALQKLISLMENSSGFAGLGGAIQQISQLVDAEDVETKVLASAILRDAALTGRLLRLANSSRFSHGSRNISTVDQAIAILGLKTVKSVAISLALLDGLANKPQSETLQAEIVAAYFCGSLAAQITAIKGVRFSSQEAQVCGLLQNIGRMMVFYYLFDDIDKVRKLQAEQNLLEDPAVLQVFGISFENVSAAVARQWNLADTIQASLDPAPIAPSRHLAASALEWHKACAVLSRSITKAMFRLPERHQRAEIIKQVDFFRDALNIREQEVQDWIVEQRDAVDALLGDIGFPCNIEKAQSLLQKPNEKVLDVLSSQDVLKKDSDALEGKTPVDIVNYYMRLMHDAAGFNRTLLCLPEGNSALRAVFGVGKNISQIVYKFRCQGAQPDIFRIVFGKRVDMFVNDIDAPNIKPLIPAWYREVVGAKAMLVMTLLHQGKPVGLLYGDYEQAQTERPQALKSEDFKAWHDRICVALGQG